MTVTPEGPDQDPPIQPGRPSPTTTPNGPTPLADPLVREAITLRGRARTKAEAIQEAGRMLLGTGAVGEGFVEAMFEREKSVSTYMGNSLAVPHGTREAKQFVEKTAMSFARYDEPIDWNGNPVRFVIAIAGRNKEHLILLGRIARVFSRGDALQALERATTADEVLDVLAGVNTPQ